MAGSAAPDMRRSRSPSAGAPSASAISRMSTPTGQPAAAMDARLREAASTVPVYPQLPFVPVRAAGCDIFTDDGRQILDLYGGHCVNTLGAGDRRLGELLAEMARQGRITWGQESGSDSSFALAITIGAGAHDPQLAELFGLLGFAAPESTTFAFKPSIGNLVKLCYF